jgi:hypothetical protein
MAVDRPKPRPASVMHRVPPSVLGEKGMDRSEDHHPQVRVRLARSTGGGVEGTAECLWVPREGSSTFVSRARGEKSGSAALSTHRFLLGRHRATLPGLRAVYRRCSTLQRPSHRIVGLCTFVPPASTTWPTPERPSHLEGRCVHAASRPSSL